MPGSLTGPDEALARKTDANRSPMLSSALALVAQSATAEELRVRFAESGAALNSTLATKLLEELAELGLVKVMRHGIDGQRYVATSLGLRAVTNGIQGDAAIPLEELERMRTDLLSTIAHELRTPLTAIRTNVGVLLDASAAPTDEQRHQLLASIDRNSDRMQRLIGDILELSRLRQGNISLQLRRFGANSLAETAAEVIGPLAANRGQTIHIDRRVASDHQVYGDRRRLEQALLNLVSNAATFSEDQGVIAMVVEERGANTAWSVTDNGSGISTADQARLFERFFVGRADRSGPREGVGLGLPTALAIAQAHGGTIDVQSSVGKGSTFTLIVPTGGPPDEE